MNEPISNRHTCGYKSLMNYVVYQALTDLGSKFKRTRVKAKEFLQSEDCEYYCMVIGFNYELIKKIDYDNPQNTLSFDK